VPLAADGRAVVVGASLAGLRAAETLRREGHTGPLTIVGAEQHWPPFDRPPLSKQVLARQWDEDRGRLRVDEGLDADLRLGRRAVALDTAGRTVTLADGTSLPYDGLVVATGAAPRMLPGIGALGGVHVLRTIEDCRRLGAELHADPPPRVAVIGAGFIGCEVAATARELGLDVTLIEALPLPVVRILGERMGHVCADLHREHGVDVRLGVGVAAVAGEGRVERVALADGSSVDADTVVVGIGVSPTTSWLEGSGVALDDGVVCDAAGAVAGVDDVVAAGDVARWPNERFGELMRVEHWTNATEMAEHAARTLLHGAAATGPFAPVPYFWSHQFGTRFQFVGTCRPDDEVVIAEGDVAERRFVAAYVRDGRTVGALCVNRANRTIPWRNHIAGEAAWPAA
jgi:NADPH-dependent 2,4-dienoyl-CoA reductase/sulfur reductase-like enzyme